MVGLEFFDDWASAHESVVVVGYKFESLVEFGLGTGLGVGLEEGVEFLALAGRGQDLLLLLGLGS